MNLYVSDAKDADQGQWLAGFERHAPAPSIPDPFDSPLALVSDGTFPHQVEYQRLLTGMTIKPGWKGVIDATARRIISNKAKYVEVANLTKSKMNPSGVPWSFIAVVHHLESNGDFSTHLANGDPLDARTTHVPKGIIPDVEPPYTFAQAAAYALRMQHFDMNKDWSMAHVCYSFEAMNGFGYRAHGINSPYLWSGTNNYVTGKYTSDGVYDANATSAQLGAIPLLNRVLSLDLSSGDVMSQSSGGTAAVAGQVAAPVVGGGLLAAVHTDVVPQYITQFKMAGFSFHEILIMGGLAGGFLLFSYIIGRKYLDYTTSRYTPSAMTEKPVTPSTVLK